MNIYLWDTPGLKKKDKCISQFERRLEHLDILCRAAHSQTNGKLERVHEEMQRTLHLFEDVAEPPGSPCPINPPHTEKDTVA